MAESFLGKLQGKCLEQKLYLIAVFMSFCYSKFQVFEKLKVMNSLILLLYILFNMHYF